ncbi:uncharacterized protein LOC111252772 isoform X4 [Varroa destructor]|uniref:VWFC domain-containing protein n=1 Tax=Varroa destructor TaxID=109461 RepID=A0A7M7KLF2_VARDE|nr:uncharacterized protein LOC111252772 isoform X4 [Varroa destructor]
MTDQPAKLNKSCDYPQGKVVLDAIILRVQQQAQLHRCREGVHSNVIIVLSVCQASARKLQQRGSLKAYFLRSRVKMVDSRTRDHVVFLCANLLTLWGVSIAGETAAVAFSDQTNTSAKTPFTEQTPNMNEQLEGPQVISGPQPDALQESSSKNRFQPEYDNTKDRDQHKMEKPQIIYIKNSDPKEPNGRPQLPHVDAVRRRYRFEDIPDFRQGQWWNERPQISQEYEKGSGLNGQRELDGSNEPPKSVNDDLSIISSLRRRKPSSANFQHHVTGGTPAPKSSSQQTIIPKPDPGTTSAKLPIPPWKRRNPSGTRNVTSANVPPRSQTLQVPFVVPPNCLYAGQKFDHGSFVTTPEPCLNCTCRAGVLVCFLRVCPAVTMVPEGCFSAREAHQCCPTVLCNKDNENTASDDDQSTNRSKDDDYGDDEGTTNNSSSEDIDESRNAIGHSGEQTPFTATPQKSSVSLPATIQLFYDAQEPASTGMNTTISSENDNKQESQDKLPTTSHVAGSSEETSTSDTSNTGDSSQSLLRTASDDTTTPRDFDTLIDEHLVTVMASDWAQDTDQNGTSQWSVASAVAPRDDSPLVVTSSLELTSISDVEAALQNRSIPGACHSDGAWFMEGSAMLPPRRTANGDANLTSNIIFQGCSFCYCLRGRRRCVRPRCALRVPGCTPRYAHPNDCCPAAYNCSGKRNASAVEGSDGAILTEGSATTTAPIIGAQQVPVPIAGCLQNGRVSAIGTVLSTKEPCRTCICSPEGLVCSPVECPLAAPECVGVTPPGHCCPIEYICDTIRNTQNETEQLKIIPDPRPGSFKETHLFRKLEDDAFLPNVTEILSKDQERTSSFSSATPTSSTESFRSQEATDLSNEASSIVKESDNRTEKTFSSSKGSSQSLNPNDQEKNKRLLPSEVQLEKKPNINSSQELHEWKLASNKVNVDASHLDPSSNDTLSLFYTPEVLLESNRTIDTAEQIHSFTAEKLAVSSKEPLTSTEAASTDPLQITTATEASPISLNTLIKFAPEHQTISKESRRTNPSHGINEGSLAKVTKNNHLVLNLDLIDFRTKADNQSPDNLLLHQHQPIYVAEEKVDRIPGHRDKAPTIRPILTGDTEILPQSQYTTPLKRVLYTTEVPKYTVPAYLSEASSPALARVQSIFIGKSGDILKISDRHGTTIAAEGSSENITGSDINIGGAITTESIDLKEDSFPTLATYTEYPVDVDAKRSRTSNSKKSTFAVDLGSHMTVAYNSGKLTPESRITTAKGPAFDQDLTLRRFITTTQLPPHASLVLDAIQENTDFNEGPSSPWVTPSATRTTTELPRPSGHVFTLQQRRHHEEHLTPTESEMSSQAEHLEPLGQPTSTTASIVYRDLGHEVESIDSQQLNQLIKDHIEKHRRKDNAIGATSSSLGNGAIGSSTHASNSGRIDFAEGVKLFSTLLLSGLAMGNRREPTSSTQISPQISSLTPNSATSPSTVNPSNLEKRYQRPPLHPPSAVEFDSHRPVIGEPQLNQFSSPIPIPVTAHPIPNFEQHANEVRLPHKQSYHYHQPQKQDRHDGGSPQLYYIDDPLLNFTNRGRTHTQSTSHRPTPPSANVTIGNVTQGPSTTETTLSTRFSVKETTEATTASSVTSKPAGFNRQHVTAGVIAKSPIGPLSVGNGGQRVVPFLADDAVFRPIANPLLVLSGSASGKKKSTSQPQNNKKTTSLKKGSNCFIGGVTYADGEVIPKTDACELCRCYFGEELCAVRRCPPPPGSDCRAEPLPGSCCPRYTCRPESVTLPPSVMPGSTLDDGFHQPNHPKFVPHIDILMAPQGDQRLLLLHQHSTYQSSSSKGSSNHERSSSTMSQQGLRRGGSSNWKKTRPLPSPSYNPFFPGPRRDTPPPRSTPSPQQMASTITSPTSVDVSPKVSSPSSVTRQTALSLENEISATSNTFSNKLPGSGEFTTMPTATLALFQHASSTVSTTTTAATPSSNSGGSGGGVFSAITDIPFIRSFFKKDPPQASALSTNRLSDFNRDRHASHSITSSSSLRTPTPAALRDENVFTTVMPSSTASISRPSDIDLDGGQKLQPLLTLNGAWNLVKVSGCNIYGKFYRVNEVVTELTEHCKVCTCTAIGVHCIQTCR